jgi:carbamate kinase
MLVVVALGAGAFRKYGTEPDFATRQANMRAVLSELAGVARDYELVLVYGNDPRAGAEFANQAIEQELRTALSDDASLTVLAQTLVTGNAADASIGADKDRIAAILAEGLGADRAIFLTDVDGVYRYWRSFAPELVAQARTPELDGRNFAGGSMAPKVEAACRFARNTGRPAFIGNISHARRVVEGTAGTRIDR